MTDRCSLDSLDANEPLAGTAPLASAWIIVEHPGPWGRDAITDSRLPEGVARHLAATEGTGVKVILARHPDRVERTIGPERHVWVARSAPGGSLLRHGTVADVAELLAWDLAAIGRGSLPAFGKVEREPVHFVCTNGTRDQCCALVGRGLLTALLDARPAGAGTQRDRLWECSHIGGHRFAPVMLTLPTGGVHSRIDVASAEEVIRLADSGEVLVSSFRGRTGLLAPHQVAAIEVRARFGINDVEAIDVLRVLDGRAVPTPPGVDPLKDAETAEAEVRHADGRAWRAGLERVPLDRPRMESCGKDPVMGSRWTCVSLEPATPWK